MNQRFSNLPITFTKSYNLNADKIVSFATKLRTAGKLDELFIDYLQLVDTPGGEQNRERQVAMLSRRLKLLAMELNIPIIILAQLNRQSEARSDKRPRLSDLRESGAIEQDADGVILLHRDFVSGIAYDKDGNSTESQADLIVAKWRNGKTGEYKLGYNGELMKFYELNT
jgi:replicative DNA helicase